VAEAIGQVVSEDGFEAAAVSDQLVRALGLTAVAAAALRPES
jgi:hypothetical protein